MEALREEEKAILEGIKDLDFEKRRCRETSFNEILEHRKGIFEAKQVLKHYTELRDVEPQGSDQIYPLNTMIFQIENVIRDLTNKIDEENFNAACEIDHLNSEIKENQERLKEIRAQIKSMKTLKRTDSVALN